ncbi:MAG: hypothetical protein IJ038_03520 [Clostridia bacterium]|nr:hypothetical protein [Clostridia bacterium]
MNREITLSAMWRVFKRSFIIILAVTIAVMLIAGLVTKFMIKETFSSSVTFYVVNTSIDTEYTTTSLLAATENLANMYIEIIKGDVTMDSLIEYLKTEYELEYTSGQLLNMMSTSIDGDSSTFVVKIENTNEEIAFIIARYLAQNVPTIIKSFVTPNVTGTNTGKMNIERVKVLKNPTLHTEADSPSLIMNVIVAGMAAAVLTYAAALVVALCNVTVKNEEDLKAAVSSKYPLIGFIPSWSNK